MHLFLFDRHFLFLLRFEFQFGHRTVGKVVAGELPDCIFLEGDDFHSKQNKAKMGSNIPLSDEDRIPWLESLRDATRELIGAGRIVVLACSALTIRYREILREADEGYERKENDYGRCKVKFVCLETDKRLIAERIEKRSTEGYHFMSPALLQSQLDLMEIDEEEGIVKIDNTESDLGCIVDRILDLVKQT